MRRLSPYLTRLLLRTPITPDGVTWLMILAGLAAAAALTIPGLPGAILAVALIQLQILLDCSDGELARWLERKSPVGVYLDRIGHWLLTIGYFLPGIRHFTALVAGMSEMKFRSFALFAYPGAVLWITSFLALGYFLGDQWEVVFNHLHQQMTLITVILSVVAVAVWYWKKRRKQKSDRRSL